MNITYTFPASPSSPHAGKTFTGGVPEQMAIGGKAETVVRFIEKIQGRQVVARISDKPDLAALVEEYRKAKVAASLDAYFSAWGKQVRNAKADALEAAVPGLSLLRTAQISARAEAERYRREFDRMMESGSGRMPKPVIPEFGLHAIVLAGQYPRAALYLLAEAQADGAHWADNTGRGHAGQRAMDILAAGGSIEEAKAALAERRELVD